VRNERHVESTPYTIPPIVVRVGLRNLWSSEKHLNQAKSCAKSLPDVSLCEPDLLRHLGVDRDGNHKRESTVQQYNLALLKLLSSLHAHYLRRSFISIFQSGTYSWLLQILQRNLFVDLDHEACIPSLPAGISSNRSRNENNSQKRHPVVHRLRCDRTRRRQDENDAHEQRPKASPSIDEDAEPAHVRRSRNESVGHHLACDGYNIRPVKSDGGDIEDPQDRAVAP
jgi:hypothetical protein